MNPPIRLMYANKEEKEICFRFHRGGKSGAGERGMQNY
jgi:hypothetical protein